MWPKMARSVRRSPSPIRSPNFPDWDMVIKSLHSLLSDHLTFVSGEDLSVCFAGRPCTIICCSLDMLKVLSHYAVLTIMLYVYFRFCPDGN